MGVTFGNIGSPYDAIGGTYRPMGATIGLAYRVTGVDYRVWGVRRADPLVTGAVYGGRGGVGERCDAREPSETQKRGLIEPSRLPRNPLITKELWA